MNLSKKYVQINNANILIGEKSTRFLRGIMRSEPLERVLEQAKVGINQKSFPSLLFDLRTALGMKIFRAAELVGVTPNRMRNLEVGFFKDMPTNGELMGISRLYDIDLQILKKKALSHVKYFKKARLRDDGPVQKMPEDEEQPDGLLLGNERTGGALQNEIVQRVPEKSTAGLG